MKFILKIVLIALLSYIAQLFMPWWSIALVAFVVNIIIYTRGFSSFIAGFLAIFLLWSIQAFLIDAANEQILSAKIASIFSMTPTLLILVTGAVGGLVAGFAALAGSNLTSLFKPSPRKSRNKYYA